MQQHEDKDDSFFGFDTRLPRDMETPTGRPAAATSKDSLSFSGLGLGLDSFGELSLEDRNRGSYSRPSAPGAFEDPWKQAADELRTLDTEEIFSEMRNSRSGSTFGLPRLPTSGERSEPRSQPPSTWEDASSPYFFADRENVEDRIRVDLSGLMDDSDSFNSAENRQEFFSEFTKQTYLPYTPREEPMSMESTSKNSSPWGSTSGPFSAFGGPWSATEDVSTETPTRQVSVDHQGDPFREEVLASINRQVPSTPNVVRTPMTLEELESQFLTPPTLPAGGSQFMTPPTPRNDSPSTVRGGNDKAGHRSPFPPQPMNPSGFHQFPTSNHPGGQHAASPSPYGLLPDPNPRLDPNMRIDPNMRHGGDFPRHGFVPIPGRMPLPSGGGRGFMPMRHPYPGPPRGWERGPHPGGPHPGGFNGFMPIRPGFNVQMVHPVHPVHSQMNHLNFRGVRPLNRQMMSQVFVNQRYLPDTVHDVDREEDDEEVTGWMTEREKDWVIKVQQSQVRTDNPYMDDYYYYVRSLKKANKDTKGTENFTEDDFIVPARMANEQKDDRPNFNNFEGSLGKVCISSVFNPRKTVDVEAINITKNRPPPSAQKRRWFVDPLQKEKGHPKGLLLGIEDLYKLVLELQDFSREIAALPEGQREEGNQTRRNIINLIFDRLIQGATPDLRIRNFCDTVKIRKGRELLRRVLPILFKEQLLILTGYCVRALPVLMDIPADKLEGFSRCLTSVEECLKAVPLKRVVEMLSPLMDTQHNLLNTTYTAQTILVQAVKNQFAMHLLSLFIGRAEECYTKEWEGLTEGEREKWTLLITYLFISLTKAGLKEVALFPTETLRMAVSQHIGRFPFSLEAVETCRAKLRTEP